MPYLAPDIIVSAPAVAWYGAITGTLGLAVSGFVAWRDRPRLIVRAMDNYSITPGPGYDPAKRYVMVTVANAGRRPVTVTHVYFPNKRTKEALIVSESVKGGPREVREGQSTVYLAAEDQLELAQASTVIAIDATGKEWRGKLTRSKPRG